MAALPPTPGSTDPVHSGNGLAFLSRPRWKLSPFLGFCSEPHNRAIRTRRLHEGYWRARRGLCCWNSNNFNMNIKQPCENKTKQNSLATRPWRSIIYWLLCSVSISCNLSLPPHCFSTPPSPHTNSKSSLCNAQPTCSLRPQPPDSAPDPSRCPADWKDLSLKSNPLFLDCHVGGQQTFYRPQLHLNIEIELRTCFVPDAEDTQNWKNAQARILKNLIINFLKNS